MRCPLLSRLWTEACGKEYALAFHAREPLLLAQPPTVLLLSLEHLATVFELEPEAAVALALRSPTLIGVPLAQLKVRGCRSCRCWIRLMGSVYCISSSSYGSVTAEYRAKRKLL